MSDLNSGFAKIISFCLNNKLIVFLVLGVLIVWGLLVAPFDWDLAGLPRDPVPVDAIPNIGENQQIVFTEWPGRSPQDVEDQITYPLTASLMGIPGVRTVRSFSMFGFSTIYIIFNENIEFYWSRSRVLEKLNSLQADLLPERVKPVLGPDATALGQVFWYTLEGIDTKGDPTGGWDLHELRSIQDFYVRYALMSAEGVSEVSSIGGFVQEFQIDVDPDAMRAADVSLEEIISAIKMSNVDVGARSIEVNKVEYVVRGIGFVKGISDIENSVIKVSDNIPIYIKNIAHVVLGPALRRGALDKEGAETVGGVVVVRFDENPLAVIKNVKEKIAEISPGLPTKELPDGTTSQVAIVPFYDRTALIIETLDTLNRALTEEILITIIIVLLLVLNIRSAMLISGLLPIAILLVFIAMKYFTVDANIVALTGIAIAIGTMVDLGIIMSENILRHLNDREPGKDTFRVILGATSEVSGAILTAVLTTVISFIPVFAMTGAEGKLFRPLAFTKTFALLAAVFVAILIIPPVAQIIFNISIKSDKLKRLLYLILGIVGFAGLYYIAWWFGIILILIALLNLISAKIKKDFSINISKITFYLTIILALFFLSDHWMPLGPERSLLTNLIFVGIIIFFFYFFIKLFQRKYGQILRWALENKRNALSIPIVLLISGLMIWQGFNTFFGWLPNWILSSPPISAVAHAFPGMGREFMPSLDEGSFLYMPTTMPHASIGEVLDVLQKQDKSIKAIPEVKLVVGKLGRTESALDPAPVSMIETLINYAPEYLLNDKGKRITYKFRSDTIDYFRDPAGRKLRSTDGDPYLVEGMFLRDSDNQLIEDRSGIPFRLWRSQLDPQYNPGREFWQGIRNPDDIWRQIVKAANIPGTTSAPKLQPIATRLVMLQSGMRSPMGVKIKGPDLETIEQTGLAIESILKQVTSVDPASVYADRIVGKPYLEIEIDREAAARYGIKIQQVQNIIEVAIGGKKLSTTILGRERYPIRVRYMRELRDSIESLGQILIPSSTIAQIPLKQLANIKYVRGPQMIRGEDGFLTGYVLFDMKSGQSEVDVVEQAQAYLIGKINSGELIIPAGVSYLFSGTYENQVRAAKKLLVIIPLALVVILIILYLKFKSIQKSIFIFSGIAVAWAGGFVLLWFYGQDWFFNFSLFGNNLRDMFNMHTYNLSVAVWVGFIALFGIASDDGVLMTTYLDQYTKEKNPKTTRDIHEAVIYAGERRVRPALMTTATTILALIPVLTSTGRGADIMIPMAIPSVGGMLFAMITMFTVPLLYAWKMEREIRRIG